MMQNKNAPSVKEGNTLPLANVLVVDDLESDIELTRILLTQHDKLQCNLLVAYNADQAMRILQTSAENGNGIDLMLLDINMPGMDGFELMEALRKYRALRQTAVVFCTGSPYQKDERRAELLCSAGYLVKPPSFDKLKPMLGYIDTLRVEPCQEGNRLLRVNL
jgi:CheY-like chemotaxis protein